MSEPPWEAIVLVSDRLDPQSLASASCVCRSWSVVMSSERLWSPLCAADFPYLFPLISAASVPARRFYSLGRAAAARRLLPPPKPSLSLADLLFAVTVSKPHRRNKNDELEYLAFSSVVSPPAAEASCSGVFCFDVVGFSPSLTQLVNTRELSEVRVTWSVAVKGWEGVVTLVEGKGESEGWFSGELPTTPCWCRRGGSSMAAEAKAVVNGDSVRVGLIDLLNWRHANVDDALAYLQHFLLPLSSPLHLRCF